VGVLAKLGSGITLFALLRIGKHSFVLQLLGKLLGVLPGSPQVRGALGEPGAQQAADLAEGLAVAQVLTA